jgi:hypothetical protein
VEATIEWVAGLNVIQQECLVAFAIDGTRGVGTNAALAHTPPETG